MLTCCGQSNSAVKVVLAQRPLKKGLVGYVPKMLASYKTDFI